MANMSTNVDKRYNEEIKDMMKSVSKELGINIEGHPSRVLAFVLTDFSIGSTVGLKVELSLGEYVNRAGSKEKVFALTYTDTQMFKPEEAQEDFEEQIMDMTEEMLEKFALQYKDDNKKVSPSKSVVTHEGFASAMKYETDYKVALSKAKRAGKPLMIFMTTNFCPWCRKLENRILSKADINARIHAKFVPLMLNFDEKKFPKQFNEINLTPTLYIVNANNEKIEQSFIGYSSRDAFLHLLKQ